MKQHQRATALVLRVKGKHLALFEQEQGRVDVVFYQSLYKSVQLQQGSLITYTYKEHQGHQKCIEDISVEHMPLRWAQQDIHLLHYILEVYYFFLPHGYSCLSSFSFFIDLFTCYETCQTTSHKKIIICKLFSLLGVYPQDSEIYTYVAFLLEHPVDNLMQQDLQLIDEGVLDQWLLWCVKMHPQNKLFKAIPHLLKSD